MELNHAIQIASKYVQLLEPHCERILVAGSVRRRKEVVKDIEIVAIPKPYDIGLFESGIATVVNKLEKVKGDLPCRYTQRILPEGIKLDLFFANPENWGLILAIRTGSADYSHHVLAKNWVKNGYVSQQGMLYKQGIPVTVQEEKQLFNLLHLPYVEPHLRNYTKNIKLCN